MGGWIIFSRKSDLEEVREVFFYLESSSSFLFPICSNHLQIVDNRGTVICKGVEDSKFAHSFEIGQTMKSISIAINSIITSIDPQHGHQDEHQHREHQYHEHQYDEHQDKDHLSPCLTTIITASASRASAWWASASGASSPAPTSRASGWWRSP